MKEATYQRKGFINGSVAENDANLIADQVQFLTFTVRCVTTTCNSRSRGQNSLLASTGTCPHMYIPHTDTLTYIVKF